MFQEHDQLNHLTVLNKDKLKRLDLRAICNEFVPGSEHRLQMLETF